MDTARRAAAAAHRLARAAARARARLGAPANPYAPPGGYPPPGAYAPPGAPTGHPPPGPPGTPGAYPPPAPYAGAPYGGGPYGAAPYGYPGYAPAGTNGLAIASFILSLVGWMACGIGTILAIVLGFVARSQIKSSGGRQGGDGLAKAGIIIGFVVLALGVAWFVVLLIASAGNTT